MSGLSQLPTGGKLRNDSRLWASSTIVVLLAAMSWQAPVIVTRIYRFTALPYPAGDYIYLALRMLIMVLLLVLFLGFRKAEGTGDPKKIVLTDVRSFDPLMGLRAFACMLVLLGHYFIVVFTPAPPHHWIARGLLLLCSASPWGGVWVFFTLSGYLMGKGFVRGRYTLDEPGVSLYLRNRMLRILPIYLISNLLLSVWVYPKIFQWKNLWMMAEILIFDYRADPSAINPIGALWSVSTEVQFYLLVPLMLVLLLALQKRLPWLCTTLSLWLLPIGVAARLYLLHHLHSSPYFSIYTSVLTNLDLFLTGLSINFIPKPLWLTSKLTGRVWSSFLITFLSVFYLAITWFSNRHELLHISFGEFWCIGPCVASGCAAVFIYVAELQGKMRLPSGLAGRILLAVQGIGTLTYCVYVFHPETYMSLRRILPEHITALQSFLFLPLVITAAFTIASIFQQFIEEPFERRKRISR